MNLYRMAWRNLWRHKRRSIITCFSIGFGVLLAVTFTGIGDYSYSNMINAGANMGFGHVTVEPINYNQNPSLDKRLQDSDRMVKELVTLPGIAEVIPRIIGQAMFSSATKSVGGMFLGIDPAIESPETNLLLRQIESGQVFDKRTGRGIVIGKKMADKLKLGIGNKIIYTTTDISGEIVSSVARVSGIFATGVSEVDGLMVLLPIDSVRASLNYAQQDASILAIFIQDYRKSDKVRDAIENLIGNTQLETLTWKKTQADMAGLVAIDRGGNYLSQFLVGLLIAAGILNTLLMSVLERTREFGVMMAVGMSPYTLFKLVLWESWWVAVIGLIVGVLITAPWYLYLANVGLDFSEVMGDNYSAGGVLIDPIMKARLFSESILAILIGVFSLTLLSGLYPAYRSGRIPPVDSLKTI